MIYRILIDTIRDLEWNPQDGRRIETRAFGGPFQGMSRAGNALLDLKPGRDHSPRARYFFTEAGWDRFGRELAEDARKGGHIVKVIRRKNPRPSRIGYRDHWQVAVLPERPR